jgi:hypothetical protein
MTSLLLGPLDSGPELGPVLSGPEASSPDRRPLTRTAGPGEVAMPPGPGTAGLNSWTRTGPAPLTGLPRHSPS